MKHKTLYTALFLTSLALIGVISIQPPKIESTQVVKDVTPAIPFDPRSTIVEVLIDGGHGSGTVIDKHHILTAKHVVIDQKDEDVFIKLSDGDKLKAKIVWVSGEGHDIALLSTDEELPYRATVDCAGAKIGDEVTGIGYPFSMEMISSKLYVSGDRYTGKGGVKVAPLDGTLLPGMSGGGVFNDKGEVVGVVTALLAVSLGNSLGIGGKSPSGITMMQDAKDFCNLFPKLR